MYFHAWGYQNNAPSVVTFCLSQRNARDVVASARFGSRETNHITFDLANPWSRAGVAKNWCTPSLKPTAMRICINNQDK